MPPEYRISIQVPNTELFRGQGRQALRRAAGRGITRVIEDGATFARQRVRVDRGVLRSSIQTRIEAGTGREILRGRIFTGTQAPYARYVEEGTRPHWVPIAPLLGWARRVLGDEGAAYAIQRHIARFGTVGAGPGRAGPQPTNVFRDMRRQLERDAAPRIRAEIVREIQRLTRGT